MNPLQISSSHFAPAAAWIFWGLLGLQGGVCLSSQRGNGAAMSILLFFLISFCLPEKRLLPSAVCSYYRKHTGELEKVQERVTSRVKGPDGLEPCGEFKKIRLEFIRRQEIKRGHDSNVKF